MRGYISVHKLSFLDLVEEISKNDGIELISAVNNKDDRGGMMCKIRAKNISNIFWLGVKFGKKHDF